MVVVYVAAFMSLGLINLDAGPRWWPGQLRRLAIGVPILLIYAYVRMPALVFPQAIELLLLPLIPNAAYGLLVAARTAVVKRRIVSIRRAPVVPYLVALGALVAFGVILSVLPVVDASGLRDVADVTTSQALPPSVDLSHVRVVPLESARFAGDKVIGQLGTYYGVGAFTVQLASGGLVWVAPLEFHGIVQWLARRSSPGVIVVSAENPDTPAELRLRRPMRYIPSAFLNDNLYRHVYLSYGTRQILETTLQLDDRGDPQYLATLGRPTIGWSGQVVTGVVIVDPESGDMQLYERAQFGNLPKWVSRVFPSDLALEYNDWFGKYVHGWWNYVIVRRDVHVPVRREVFGLLAGPNFEWFVDHTSPASDQSMTGFTYMDTVSGKIIYYTSSGGEFNSLGAENAVASNPIVRQGRLTPTQPILYNVFGQNTWIVPLVADTGKYQSLALVQAKNGHVVIGSSGAPSPQNDAFAQYAAFLGVGVPRTVTQAGAPALSGEIDRISNETGGVIYFTLRNHHDIFRLDASSGPQAQLARPGDRVSFRADAPVNGSAGIATRAVSGFADEALR